MSTLNKLNQGQKAIITSFSDDGRISRRLKDLGVVENTTISCVKCKKGISAYFVKGTIIALRDCDTESVNIKLLSEVN